MRRRSPPVRAGVVLALVSLVLGVASCGGGPPQGARRTHDGVRHLAVTGHGGTTTTSPPPTTTTGAPPPSTTSSLPSTTTSTTATTAPAPTMTPSGHGPITEPPLPSPAAGFVSDQVTAVGDSVMIDYEGALENDVPGLHVTAAVSRWWTTGEAVLSQLKSEDALGAVVIVGLGTNGPVTAAQFDAMMSVLSGASRVVFVNLRVDRTWQDPNNAVLAQGVARYPRAVLVDWYSLAVQNPGWLYSTQTHLPIDGPGAQALAALVASAA